MCLPKTHAMTNALILIVEDEPEIAEILDAYLVREGFRTYRAADGQVAIDVQPSIKPDLVLLDVKMPRRDGWAVATPEGWREVKSGDWILTDDTGNSWPMSDAQFQSLYAPA